MPTEFDLVGGTTVLTFTNVSGTVSFDQFNGPSNGADGGTGFAATTAVTATNSLATGPAATLSNVSTASGGGLPNNYVADGAGGYVSAGSGFVLIAQ